MSLPPSLRSRFVRVLVEAIQLQSGGQALPRLKQHLPTRSMRLLSRAVLSARLHDETIELEPAVELLLGIDQALCGGSGQVLTRAAAALSSRVLANGPELVSPGETVRTLKCLRAPFEQPFVNIRLEFSVERTNSGFTLNVALPGYPQATPLLRALALGYAQSAVTFSGDHQRVFGLSAEVEGECIRVVGRISTSNPHLARTSVPADKPRPRASGRSRPSLAARVDQILQGQSAVAGRQSPSGERNGVVGPSRERASVKTGVVPAVSRPAQDGADGASAVAQEPVQDTPLASDSALAAADPAGKGNEPPATDGQPPPRGNRRHTG